MSSKDPSNGLSRRERQIMEIVYAQGEATENGDETDNDVDGELELDEFPDIVEDHSSPTDSSVD